jgi:N-acetylglucosaminyl-diphospho-decaprenol L-rhamnosyltransferase
MAPTIAIIIVNFRTPHLVVDCLRSLVPEIASVPGTTVIITDNASGDDSVARMNAAIAANGWNDWARVVPLARNGGFSFGNNRGIEQAQDAEYFLLLNSDTIVHPGVLKNCLETMQREPKLGVMSCMLQDPDGSMQNAARNFPTQTRLCANNLGLPQKFPKLLGWADTEDPGWDRTKIAKDVDWLGGAFLFIRGDLQRKIGGLDEDFFFYGEDVEFCHRVHKAGYRVFYDPATSIIHIGGASGDPSRGAAKARNARMWNARYLLLRKCHGRLAAAFVRGVDVSVYFLRALKLRLLGQKNSEKYVLYRDVLTILCKPLNAPVASPISSSGGK